MRKKIMWLLMIVALALVACDTMDVDTNQDVEVNIPESLASYDYYTFEEAVLEFATDIVVAQYVESQPFGENITVFEFVVTDRILGEATDRIFIYATHNISAHVGTHERVVSYIPGDLSFVSGVDYLLPIRNINSPHSAIARTEDSFVFIRNIVIDLAEPSNSGMYSEPIDYHIVGMTFSEETMLEEIIVFVEDLAVQIEATERWERVFIRSEIMEDIIKGSPYVWVVEINEPLRLSEEQSVTDWGLTDIYYVTIIESLKGDVNGLMNEFLITFTADTVFYGEQHIVAAQPISKDAIDWFVFTSRNSLFSLDRLDEIRAILATAAKTQDYDYSDAGNLRNDDVEADYLLFEDAIELATDLVIVQFVERWSFGEILKAYEFIVLDVLSGSATERIIVYQEKDPDLPNELVFTSDENYLLPLIRVESEYSSMATDEFVFIRNLFINLDTPSNSMMNNDALSLYSYELDFTTDISREAIILFIKDLLEIL